jgi:hypothetical protein
MATSSTTLTMAEQLVPDEVWTPMVRTTSSTCIPVLAGGRGEWSDLLLHAGAVARLDLAEHRALKSGVVLLTYRPKEA